MFDTFVVDEECVFKGAGRVVLAPIGTAFPTELADVMNVTTFALTSAWRDWGGTTCEGITLMRGFDKDPGIEVCQLGTAILKAGASNWRGRVGFNLLETCLTDLDRAWEGSTDGAQVVDAQESYQDFGTPDEVTVYRIAVIQQHSRDDANLRMFAIRRGSLAGEDSEMVMNNTDASSIPVTLEMEIDPAIGKQNNMFRVFHYQA
jgi:hypothetical protein